MLHAADFEGMGEPIAAGLVVAEVLRHLGERLSMLNPGRKCTVCTWKGSPEVLALYVVTDADGLQWFECESHSPTDNVAQTVRVRREPIDEWFAPIPAP
jgi:hypothetical protein